MPKNAGKLLPIGTPLMKVAKKESLFTKNKNFSWTLRTKMIKRSIILKTKMNYNQLMDFKGFYFQK